MQWGWISFNKRMLSSAHHCHICSADELTFGCLCTCETGVEDILHMYHGWGSYWASRAVLLCIGIREDLLVSQKNPHNCLVISAGRLNLKPRLSKRPKSVSFTHLTPAADKIIQTGSAFVSVKWSHFSREICLNLPTASAACRSQGR